MTSKQLVVLILASSLTFLAIVLGGGYVYMTKPALLGIPAANPVDTLTEPIAMWEVEIERLQRQYNHATELVTQLRDSLSALRHALSSTLSRSDSLQQQLNTALGIIAQLRQSAQRDSVRLKNLHTLAEMYDRADPAEVAKILAGAESSYAAAVLRLMKRKTAAKVIEQLPKDKALAISLAALDQP